MLVALPAGATLQAEGGSIQCHSEHLLLGPGYIQTLATGHRERGGGRAYM